MEHANGFVELRLLYDAAGREPAIFVPSYFGDQTLVKFVLLTQQANPSRLLPFEICLFVTGHRFGFLIVH